MSRIQNKLFAKIQENSDINPQTIYQVAESLEQTDLSDEQTVRTLVQRLAKLANSSVSEAKENKIVEAVTHNNVPTDMNSLNNLYKK